MTTAVTPPGIEERWASWLAERNKRGLRTILWIVLLLYPAFGVLDYLMAPARALPVLYATRFFVAVITMYLFKVIRTRFFERHAQFVPAAYTTVCASGITVMTGFLGGLESPYYAGLGLVIVGTAILFVWEARTVLITHGAIVTFYIFWNLLLERPKDYLGPISNLAFLVSTAIITGTGQIVLFRLQREQAVSQIILEQTTANLEVANRQLKELDRFKSQFFANVTHEFKTPLAMILSPLELILNGDLGKVAQAQRANFEMMFRSGIKLLKMIGDLLDLSKLEESRLRLKVAEHDLVEHLRGLCEQVQPLAQRKGIELSLDACESCRVHCDLDRMERVFVNLLSNALKFTPDGGHVKISIREEGGLARIVVEDDGPGFPAELSEQLFERFFQVDMGETRRHGGTGIGLALAKEIVELHGGSIRAETGRGARFTVVVPRDRDHFRAEVLDRRSHRREVAEGARESDRGLLDFAAQIQARTEFRLLDIHEATERRVIERDPDEAGRSHTCLVVEDTPDVVRLVSMALRAHFRLISAADGIQGLELAQRELPSLIVTDLMMPGMNGLELTRRLREDARTRHIPILMLTAHGELEDRVAGLDTGVNSYLAKPFSPRELLSAARSLVQVQATQADILLTQRMDSLEVIAGGLAHEINNPLNYVKNALARVRLDVQQLLEPQARSCEEGAAIVARRAAELFDIAESGIRRIARTVELMGNYGRAGYSRELRPYDAFQAAREVVGIVLPATGRKTRVEMNFEGDGRVDCVPEELNQVLTNLIQNALEASPADASGCVRIEGRLTGEVVELCVEDNGPGIRPEDRARIFTPFFTTKGPGRGMGLGLTIAWRVVQSLGGAIDIGGAPGAGALFTVRLPRRQPARGAA